MQSNCEWQITLTERFHQPRSLLLYLQDPERMEVTPAGSLQKLSPVEEEQK